jgi:CAAX protease family protein
MRRLPVWGFIALVVVYILLVQWIPSLTRPSGTEYGNFETVEEITRGLWVTTGVGSAIVLIAVAVLRWWRPVFVEDMRLPRWVWVFPIVMVVAILVGISYPKLADKGLTFTLLLLVGSLLIGLSEEGMFRGIGVVTFRQAGFSEGMVALWTSVIFGLVHATNIFTEGAGAIPQVLVTAVAGYFFYLARRVSGTLIVPIVLHGLWDFTLISDVLGDSTSFGATAPILADIVLIVVAIVTIRKVFPKKRNDEARA